MTCVSCLRRKARRYGCTSEATVPRCPCRPACSSALIGGVTTSGDMTRRSPVGGLQAGRTNRRGGRGDDQEGRCQRSRQGGEGVQEVVISREVVEGTARLERGRGSVTSRVLLEGKPIHIIDVLASRHLCHVRRCPVVRRWDHIDNSFWEYVYHWWDKKHVEICSKAFRCWHLHVLRRCLLATRKISSAGIAPSLSATKPLSGRLPNSHRSLTAFRPA